MRLLAGLSLASAGVGLVLGIVLCDGRVAKARAAHESDRALWAAQLADARAQALQAEQAATAREHALQAEFDQLDQEARHAKQALETARADAATAADRLRIALDTIRHSRRDAPSATAAAASQCAPAADAVGVLADVLASADARAGALADFADRAHAAGQRCEQAYASAREALK